jgi:endoglucanase
MSFLSGRRSQLLFTTICCTVAAIYISYLFYARRAVAFVPPLEPSDIAFAASVTPEPTLTPVITPSPTPAPTPDPTPEVTPTPDPTTTPTPTSKPSTSKKTTSSSKNTSTSNSGSSGGDSGSSQGSSSSSSLAGKSFFADTGSAPGGLSGGDLDVWNTLAAVPQAFWLGDWQPDTAASVRSYASRVRAAGKTGVIVLYNIPQRDCGSYSAGGTHSASAYQSWVSGIASAVRGTSMVALVEPDSLSLIDCLSGTDKDTRYSLLQNAVQQLKDAGAYVYLDAGHSGWISVGTMADRLRQAGIDQANGFTLNVSNFQTTASETSYGSSLSSQIGGKHFVIDTSRNGNGPAGSEWCNPWGRAVGAHSTTSTGNGLVDAYIWIKHPGESDGTCNGGPSAGTWWPAYAASLL